MARRPNVLLIILHDLGTHLGCYGKKTASSPNIDALAEEGARFVNHFSTAPYCSPSRGSIITGKWPNSNGLLGLVNLGWNLPPHTRTMAQIFGDAGYETFLFGLQHEAKDVNQLGFQHVHPCPSPHCADVAPGVAAFLRKRSPTDSHPFYARLGFIEVHRLGVTGYERYADAAPDPDSIETPAHLKDGLNTRQDLAQFYGCIRHTDAAMGTILKALDESGLKENTIVILTTDHGIDFPRAKATLYDPGINTTLIVRWPMGMENGRVYTELLSGIDLLPTLLEAADVPVPEDVEGRSFLGLLQAQDYTPNEMIFAEKNTRPTDIKRCVRTLRWKYIRNFNEGPGLCLTTGMEASLTRRDMNDDHLKPRPQSELYDLDADPNEFSNLSGDPDFAQVESAMAKHLQDWMARTDDPVLRGPMRRPPDEAALLQRVRDRLQAARRRARDKS